jgi:hypothetical protein
MKLDDFVVTNKQGDEAYAKNGIFVSNFFQNNNYFDMNISENLTAYTYYVSNGFVSCSNTGGNNVGSGTNIVLTGNSTPNIVTGSSSSNSIGQINTGFTSNL